MAGRDVDLMVAVDGRSPDQRADHARLQLARNALARITARKIALARGIDTMLPRQQSDDKHRSQHHGQKGGACVFEL